ncbi:hypothetical protein ACFX1R_027906 [Malus domestica]
MLHRIPICFTAVTQLDLSHLSPWGYALLSTSAANTAHLLLAQSLRDAFPWPPISELLLNSYNQSLCRWSPSFLDCREAGFGHFVKHHGLGNDFILVDNRSRQLHPEQAAKLGDRNFGLEKSGLFRWLMQFAGFRERFNAPGPSHEMRLSPSTFLNFSKNFCADFNFIRSRSASCTPCHSFSAAMSTVPTQNDVVPGQSESTQKTQQSLQM